MHTGSYGTFKYWPIQDWTNPKLYLAQSLIIAPTLLNINSAEFHFAFTLHSQDTSSYVSISINSILHLNTLILH